MPVYRCKQEIPNRECQCWWEKFRQDWNKPSRSDHYLMLIAHRIQYLFSRSKTPASLEEQKIPFEIKKVQANPKQASLWSKAFWFASLGLRIKRDEPRERD